MKFEPYVKASELGEFVFCKRGWWLTYNNLLPDSPTMQEGAEKHEEIATRISQFRIKNIIAWILILTGIILLGIIFAFLSSNVI